jgi:hypothetical protein
MITLKPITPKTMAAKFKSAPDAVAKGMRGAAEGVKKDFESSTATWQHKPIFTIEPHGSDFVVGTTDEIYGYVDAGTRPHVIVARRARVLRFAPGGSPKTTPGRVTASGGSKGSGAVFVKRVNHPGTKARLFTKQIAERWRRGTAPFIRQALEEHFR